MNVAFPYRVDGRGRTAEAENNDAHLRELIEQLLFTDPGERVNRPDFGCGLMQIEEVSAASEDATLTVVVRYTVLRTQASASASFTRRVSA